MRDALIVHTAFTDFSRPPVDLALLKAACVGLDVHTVDLNLRAFHELTSIERVADLVATGEARLSALVKRTALGFWEQQELASLAHALADGIAAKDHIAQALDTFRSADLFYTRDHYTAAVKATEGVWRLACALTFPFHFSATGVAAPFSVYSEQAVSRFRAIDPLRAMNDKVVADLDARALVFVLSDAGQFLHACTLAKVAREKRPEVTLVACGPWLEQACATKDDHSLLHAFFDAVITTDPERLLPALLADRREDKLKAHPGIAFAPAMTLAKAKAHAPLDVGALAAPDFSDLPLASYPTPEPTLTFRASRDRNVSAVHGNWWAIASPRRVMAAAQAAAQVLSIAHKFEARLVALTGDAYELSWLESFAQALVEQGGGVKWSADVVCDRPVEQADRFKASGCVSLVFCTKDGASHELLGRTIEALAHAGVAAQLMTSYSFPNETEDQAREALAVLKSHHQEIDLVGVMEHDAHVRLSVKAAGAWLAGDGFGVYPEFARLGGLARERIADEHARVLSSYSLKPAPFAGAVGSTHTLLGFEKFGRRVFASGQRAGAAAGVAARALGDGDKVKLSSTAKVLWIPYQLTVFDEIAREENELREMDLLRRHKDNGADKVWAYSDRGDLKLRAQQRLPHVLGPGMPVTEISLALADLLQLITEQPLPVSQLIAKVPRELKDALRRQLQTLHAHGALVSETQARQHTQSRPQPGAPQNNGGGAPGGGPGRRRRRRRRSGGPTQMGPSA